MRPSSPPWLFSVLVLGVLSAGRLAAQDPVDTSIDEDAPLSAPPVAVLNVASVDRVLEDIDYLFGSVKRDDMREVIEGLLGNLGDLQGLDRGKPFGVMLFLKPAVVPQPVPVGYLPVSDIASLTRTVELGPVTTKKIAEDRYEVIGQRRTLYARLIGDYAFVATEEEVLDREIPVPTEAFAGLTTRFDVAVDLRPDNVPPGMRDLFLNLVRTQMQANLQQRDNESTAAYTIRKSQGENNLRMVEAFLKETRTVTLGLDTSPQNRKAVIELIVEALPNTPYLEALQGLAEDASRFAPVLADDVPLSLSLNGKLDEASKKMHTGILDAGEQQVARIVTRIDRGDDLEAAPQEAAPVEGEADPAAAALAARIFGPLKQVVQDGNLDLFAQFRGDAEQKFALIAGIEVADASAMESAVRELIDRVRSASPEAESALQVEYGAADAGGVTLHKVSGREVRESERRMYGDQFAIYFGFDATAIWIAIGGPQAVAALDDAVTRIKEAGPAERNRDVAPFQLVITAQRWVGLNPSRRRSELAREAFEKGNDTLRIDFKPTDKGGRLRIEAEEGFIRLLGLGVSRRYDESQL